MIENRSLVAGAKGGGYSKEVQRTSPGAGMHCISIVAVVT